MIDEYKWTSAIPAAYTGLWQSTLTTSTFMNVRVFNIAADGTGHVFDKTIPGFGPAAYQYAKGGNENDKLLLTVAGIGRCMFDIHTKSAEDGCRLVLENPVSDSPEAEAVLALYSCGFGPEFQRPAQVTTGTGKTYSSHNFNCDQYDWAAAVPEEFTGTWEFLMGGNYWYECHTINKDGTGTILINSLQITNGVRYQFTTDKTKMMLTIKNDVKPSRCIYDVGFNGQTDSARRLLITNPVPDAGGETLDAYSSADFGKSHYNLGLLKKNP